VHTPAAAPDPCRAVSRIASCAGIAAARRGVVPSIAKTAPSTGYLGRPPVSPRQVLRLANPMSLLPFDHAVAPLLVNLQVHEVVGPDLELIVREKDARRVFFTTGTRHSSGRGGGWRNNGGELIPLAPAEQALPRRRWSRRPSSTSGPLRHYPQSQSDYVERCGGRTKNRQ